MKAQYLPCGMVLPWQKYFDFSLPELGDTLHHKNVFARNCMWMCRQRSHRRSPCLGNPFLAHKAIVELRLVSSGHTKMAQQRTNSPPGVLMEIVGGRPEDISKLFEPGVAGRIVPSDIESHKGYPVSIFGLRITRRTSSEAAKYSPGFHVNAGFNRGVRSCFQWSKQITGCRVPLGLKREYDLTDKIAQCVFPSQCMLSSHSHFAVPLCSVCLQARATIRVAFCGRKNLIDKVPQGPWQR